MTAPTPGTDLVHVRVLGLPVALYLRARERHEGLLREFALLAVQEEQDADSVPKRLLDFGDDLRGRYGGLTESGQARLDEAAERGEEAIDLDYDVPPGAADAGEAYLALLDEVDAYCREGDLLTLAPDAEVVAFRRWYLGEFVQQLRGGEPTPWRDARAALDR